MFRYLTIARQIVYYAYRVVDKDSMTSAELLEATASDDVIDHILVGDQRKQADRLTRLDTSIRIVLSEYERKRLRCPLHESTVAPGTYIPQFAQRANLAQANLEFNERFRMLPDLRGALLALNDREFEHLCGAALRVVGCTNITVTRSVKDDGVDAIAQLHMNVALSKDTPLYRLAGSLSFLVYGQAKRYSVGNPVQQDEVFEMQGSWQALRNEYADGKLSPAQASALERADYRSADPVLLVMMTSSYFTTGAVKKAEAIGAILLDGEQIAQLLIEDGCCIGRTTSGQQVLDVAPLLSP